MKKYLYILALAVLSAACCSGGHNENYTVVVSLDAFRWDYPSIHSTPNLDAIGNAGVSAVMKPSFPSVTFPNHYCLATGLVPDHNGIVNSQFWDPQTEEVYSMGDTVTRNNASYYNGEPIWNTAERQGVKTGCIYWVGSDVPIGGSLPSYSKYWYDEPRLDFPGRCDEAVRLLSLPEDQRPRLVMVYFDEPDMVGHHTGPYSAQTGQVIAHLDSLIGDLNAKLHALPYSDKVNLIVLSDHGMTEISDERFVRIGDYLKPEWYHHIESINPTNIYSNPGCRDSILLALKDVEHINVWKKEEVPSHLVYGSSPRVGDVVVSPECGWQFAMAPRGSLGAHGADPECPDMQVVFRACGPDFKKGYVKSEKFVNVDIYPMLSYLLGIRPEKTDGNLRRVKDIFN